MFEKHHSIVISEIVFNILERQLTGFDIEDKLVCRPTLETFYNCREQGYVLKIWPLGKKELRVWIYEDRGSDNIMVLIGNDISDSNFPTEEIWRNGKNFKYNEFYEAAKYAKEKIVEYIYGEEK